MLGSPIAHSRSPQLHLAAYRALGLVGWTYDRIECTADELPGVVGGFGPEWVGVSVTMPGKFAALRIRRRTHRAGGTGRFGQHAGALGGRLAGRQHRHRRGDGCSGRRVGACPRCRLRRHRTRGGGGLGRAWCATDYGGGAQSRPRPHRWSISRRGRVSKSGWCDIGGADLVPAVAESAVVVNTVPADAVARYASLFAATPLLLDAIYDPWPTPLAAAVEVGRRTGHQRTADAAPSSVRSGRAVHGVACAHRGDEGRTARTLVLTRECSHRCGIPPRLPAPTLCEKRPSPRSVPGWRPSAPWRTDRRPPNGGLWAHDVPHSHVTAL